MNRRLKQDYTVWIASTGKQPIVLSVRPVAIALALLLPLVGLGAIIFSVVQQNVQLNRKNTQLNQEAATILKQVEALESTLSDLQEQAGMNEDQASEEETELDAEFEDAETTSEFDQLEEGSEALDTQFGSEDDAETDQSDYQSYNPQGGDSIGGAEAILAAAKAKLPDLLQAFEVEIQPAMAVMIERHQAKPDGKPLSHKEAELTSTYGLRPNPFGWGYEFHQGIDFVAPYGSPIDATAPGTVKKAGWEAGYGNHVLLDHGHGYETLYGHLSDVAVEMGEWVDRDQVIGYLGNTGRSTGPHLHYSIFYNEQAVDPKPYLE